MLDYRKVGLVIVAYKRAANLSIIIELALKAEVPSIYIAIDNPKLGEDLLEVSQVEEIAEKYAQLYTGRVSYIKRAQNYGSSGNVRAAITEATKLFENIIVLEDDCIPALDFFKFCDVAFEFMTINPQVVLACGSQFVFEENSVPVLSSYPLIWGWCTNRANWNLLLDAYELKAHDDDLPENLRWSERAFWKNGRRRSLSGRLDAWDIPLAAFMLSRNLLALHSPVNLISNSGNDDAALHVRENDPFCNRKTSEFTGFNSNPISIPKYDLWLRKNLFMVKPWHPLTGLVRRAIDYFS